MSDVGIKPVPAGSALRVESHGADVRIIFPAYREPHFLVRRADVLLSPLVFGPFAVLFPINYLLRRLGWIAPPVPRVRRHFEVEVSAERLTFLHWYGGEVWEAADVRDVFIAEAGGDGSEYGAVFCAVSGSPVQSSEPVKGHHYLFAQNGRLQITHDILSKGELMWLKDTMKTTLGLPLELPEVSGTGAAR
jgi:hypothetical protein